MQRVSTKKRNIFFQAMLVDAEFIKQNPASRIEALLGLGICDMELGNTDSAIEAFELSNQLHVNLASIEHLVTLYQAKGDLKNLQRVAEQALRLKSIPQASWNRFQAIRVSSACT